MDALAVGMDLLSKALDSRPSMKKANVAKRLLLVSNFLTPVGRRLLRSFEVFPSVFSCFLCNWL